MRLWILCCLVAAMAAKPTDDNPEEVDFYSGKDNFRYEYKQDDGSHAKAMGQLKNGYLTIKGVYSYTVGNVTYTVRYEADEKGYRPTIEERPSEEAPPGPPFPPGPPIQPGQPGSPGIPGGSILATLLGAG